MHWSSVRQTDRRIDGNVVAEGAIIFALPPPAGPAIVRALQKRPEVGAIFTRPRRSGDAEGTVPGTLSFDVAKWNHAERSGEILVSSNWTREKNQAGYEGSTTDGGVAGHGSSSPYDIHNTLIAAGPDFREHVQSPVPTGNVDLAPPCSTARPEHPGQMGPGVIARASRAVRRSRRCG